MIYKISDLIINTDLIETIEYDKDRINIINNAATYGVNLCVRELEESVSVKLSNTKLKYYKEDADFERALMLYKWFESQCKDIL